MRFFSRKKKLKKRNNGSYVRAWSDKRWAEMRTSRDPSIENLFAALIFSVSSFGKEDPKEKKSNNMKEMGFDGTERYGTDSALFEVGSYLFFSCRFMAISE